MTSLKADKQRQFKDENINQYALQADSFADSVLRWKAC